MPLLIVHGGAKIPRVGDCPFLLPGVRTVQSSEMMIQRREAEVATPQQQGQVVVVTQRNLQLARPTSYSSS